MRYQIELRYFYGWDDAGWSEETNTGNQPMRFSTFSEAQVALDEFFDDVKTAVVGGDMDSEANPTDYRIVKSRD